MVKITYERADGREDSVRLNVDRADAEEEFAELFPDATIIDVQELKPPPRLPDVKEMANRRVKQKFGQLVSIFRDVLDERGIDHEDMTYQEMLDPVWPHLPDRAHQLMKELRKELDDL